MWFKRESPQREQPVSALADISLKEQGEIRALQGKEEEREEGKVQTGVVRRARTPASLSCQVDGRPEI